MAKRAARLVAGGIIATTVAAGTGSWASVATGAPTTTALCRALPGAVGPVPFAPYVDVTLHGQPTIDAVACAAGIREFSLAFFTALGARRAPPLPRTGQA